MSSTKHPVLICLIGWLTAAPAAPQSETTVVEALTRLNETLVAIEALLARQAEAQELDLLLKRAELASARIVEIDGRLDGLESTRRSVDDQRARLRDDFEMMLRQLEAGDHEATPAEERAYRERMEDGIERAGAHLEALDAEIALLRNRRAQRQEELRDWQDLLDTRLSTPAPPRR